MAQEKSNGHYNRLGNKIRESDLIDENTINELQEFRVSHQESLSDVFNTLCDLVKKIHPTSIVTYRIKRFESIIGKLKRQPQMMLSRMWDIAGCRCIVRNQADIYKLVKYLEEDQTLEVKDRRDYITSSKPDGYRSYHLYIRCKKYNKIVEVQLRNFEDHNWATLVEITDIFYDSKIKEFGGQINPDLARFHYLLSKSESLSNSEKWEFAQTIKNYNYFETLSTVFTQNYIKVREQWFEVDNQKKYRYFLIETTKNKTPKITSFKYSSEAEAHYLSLYKSSKDANIVLTHVLNPDFNQINTAYSNYILTFHTFLGESLYILQQLLVDAFSNKEYIKYFKIVALYLSLTYLHFKNLNVEYTELKSFSFNRRITQKKIDHKLVSQWKKDIEKQADQYKTRSLQLYSRIRRANGNQSKFSLFIFRNITNAFDKYYNSKVKRMLKENSKVKTAL